MKQGDRVPPDGTYVYTWNPLGWPTTAGVWLYHDHSICDTESVNLGAIGLIVIHNTADKDGEVDIRAGDPNDPSKLDPAFLPGGSATGPPIRTMFFPIPPLPPHFPFRELRILPGDLHRLGVTEQTIPGQMAGMEGTKMAADVKPKRVKATEAGQEIGAPVVARTLQHGNLLLELDEKLEFVRRLGLTNYLPPPSKALYMQLFHELTGAPGMTINGRAFLGNTPTVIAGPTTRMRFGVVAMGTQFHTFHIHGHRWIIPGPAGTNPTAIQGSPQVQAVSQFEDTRTFGPANSFVFTIEEGDGFLRAAPPIGEWHMHCHVLAHMDMGMMGSLLIINGGEVFTPLPVGVPCEMPTTGGTQTVVVKNTTFTPNSITVAAGSTVTFDFQETTHTVQTVSTNMASPITITNDPGGNPNDFGQIVPIGQRPVTINGMSGGQINYQWQ